MEETERDDKTKLLWLYFKREDNQEIDSLKQALRAAEGDLVFFYHFLTRFKITKAFKVFT